MPCYKNTGDFPYVHTNGKLYSCGSCKAFESPEDLPIVFHVGKVTDDNSALLLSGK